MRKYLAILAMATLVACSGKDKDTGKGDDDDDAVGDDDDDDDATGCTTIVATTFPEDGATDAYFKSDVRFQLSSADTTATIEVMDAGGGAVSGSSTTEGTLVIWQGDDFSPTSDYTATLTYCGGTAEIGFTTSATGASTGGNVVDRVYDLDLASGSWILPSPEVGGLLATELDVQLLFMPISADTEITMRGSLGDGAGNQDVCSPTIEFPPAAFEDPFFQIASDLLTLEVAGYAIDVQDLDLSGAFTPSGNGIEGASLRGVIDTRPLVEVLAAGGADDAVCQLVAVFGVSCVDCGGGEPYCLEVWVDSIEADELGGASPLTVIEQADIDANPACAGG